VDDRLRLKEILLGLRRISMDFSLPVVLSCAPRTRKMIESFGFDLDGIQAMNPVGFLEFLQLESNALLAMTDSGGVQEGDVHPGRALRDVAG
jgi:UDP-N-acetylglucosamine 2-epimerase (non-hydrolysing)